MLPQNSWNPRKRRKNEKRRKSPSKRSFGRKPILLRESNEFFEHQEKSKRNTAVLVALFSLAVSLIILAVYFVVMVVFFSSSADPGSTGSQPEIFIMVGLGVLMIIFGGSLFKSMALRRGGLYVQKIWRTTGKSGDQRPG
ncbi:MAG: hypothetical protein R2875_10090 [Desulfobacterales bacterium]